MKQLETQQTTDKPKGATGSGQVETHSFFKCEWCKEAGCDPGEYTYPLSFYAQNDDDGNPMCNGCFDEALTLMDVYP